MAKAFFQEFFQALGFIAGLIAAIAIVRWYFKVRFPARAPVITWAKFLEELLAQQLYSEAAIVRDLIRGKNETEKVKTPKQFKVYKKKKMHMEDKYEQATFSVVTDYIIEVKDK